MHCFSSSLALSQTCSPHPASHTLPVISLLSCLLSLANKTRQEMRGRDGRSGAFSLREKGRMTRVDAADFSLLNARVLVSLPYPFPCSRPHSSLPHSLLILYFGSLTSPFSTIPFPVFMSLCFFSMALFLSSLAQH